MTGEREGDQSSQAGPLRDTQWYAYWEGVHQAVQYWANGTPMKCPYETPPQAEQYTMERDIHDLPDS